MLRGEWGFVGRVLSDYIGSGVCKSYVSIYGGLYAGNDQRLNTNEGFFSLAGAEKNPTVINSAGIMIWGGLLCRGARPRAASI